ncbi:hypothetical protein K432DRAFT_9299 [Lepidopterella palustris CBS 459.81]|uniref:Uncharacterized protein n=1 Tax=Lepidopterella palustris CBS 459.81 TaxID=1314670 RepID=A0A8E2EDF6_9PEZI|nr:hypothetical protein K432DRAFT_9299 [Lepidopterella palustris CBS 459.81]
MPPRSKECSGDLCDYISNLSLILFQSNTEYIETSTWCFETHHQRSQGTHVSKSLQQNTHPHPLSLPCPSSQRGATAQPSQRRAQTTRTETQRRPYSPWHRACMCQKIGLIATKKLSATHGARQPPFKRPLPSISAFLGRCRSWCWSRIYAVEGDGDGMRDRRY